MAVTTIPLARELTSVAIDALPVDPVFARADPVEGHPGGAGYASQDCFGRHGVRLSVLSGGVEVDRFYSHWLREDATAYLAAHPGVTFALLADAVVLDGATQEPVTF